MIHAEPIRSAPAEFSAGQFTRRIGIIGVPASGELARVLGSDQRAKAVPKAGLVLSRKLAEVLGVKRGDLVHVRVLAERRPEGVIPVADFAEDFSGMAAYMDLDALNRFLGAGDRIDGARLTVARGEWNRFLDTMKNTPKTAGVVIKEAMRESFRKTTAESIGLIQTMYSVFATLVAFGIAYNSARIALSERQRELATLRVLGFSEREVGGVLVMELIVLALCAVPIGLVLGSFLANGILQSVNTETIRLPLILTTANYAYAALVVLVSTAISLAFACRKLNQLDLVGALKAPE